jgi:hypothetical protein
VFALDGKRGLRLEVRGADPIALGQLAARQLVDAGAGEILDAFDKAARLDRPAAHEVSS